MPFFLKLIWVHLCILIIKINSWWRPNIRIRWYYIKGKRYIYPINFTQPNKRSVLILHYNESGSFLFVNATKIYQFKAKNSEIEDYAMSLGKISKDFKINNMKKPGLKGVGLKGLFFCWF